MSGRKPAPQRGAKRRVRPLSEEELRAAIRRHTQAQGPRCKVQLLIKPDPIAHDLYRRLVPDAAVPSRVVADVISETAGIRISHHVLERHRAGECVHCRQEEKAV